MALRSRNSQGRALSPHHLPQSVIGDHHYPAGAWGASVTVNGHTVGLDIYTPRSFAMPHTNNVLVFVYGGQFKTLARHPRQRLGIGQALITDSSVNVLTVVPQYEKYTPPDAMGRTDSATPKSGHDAVGV